MAIKIDETFPPLRYVPSSAEYPYGAIKPSTSPNLKDGSPLLAEAENDWQGFSDALLASVSLTPSGDPDTALVSQRLEAINTLISNAVLNVRELFDINPVAGGATLEVSKKYLLLDDSANYTLPDTTGLLDGDFVRLYRVGGFTVNPIIDVDGTNSETISFYNPSNGSLLAGPDTSARIKVFTPITLILRNGNWEV